LNLRTEIDRFENLEDVGASIAYRCLRCRNCSDCRKGEFLEQTSLEEEADEALLLSCVWYNPTSGQMEANLPFRLDPAIHLKDNKYQAEKMLQSQLKAINKKPGCKDDIHQAFNKLKDKGHIVRKIDLSPDIQELIDNARSKYYIPWSVVYKPGSLSSPFRIVFNASMKTASGHSLNSILAKGLNKLPRILELLVMFGLKRHAFSCDISMAYNAIKLTPAFYTFQRFLWAEGLNPQDPVVEMIICTLIYGVMPSGGLMTAGFKATGEYAIKNHPDQAEGADVLENSSYVDDVMHSVDTEADRDRIAASLSFVLSLAGMNTKGYTFSGKPPPETMSSDGLSVGVLGYTWWPQEDLMSLASKPLSLGKGSRGKAPPPISGDIKTALAAQFTRRILSGKVCGVYDPKGLATPITSRIKLCLSAIVDLKLDWDDKIPDKYLDVWVKNLADIQALSDLRFQRCFLHPLSVNQSVELFCSVDASKNIAVAVVHARTLLPNGNYGVRLVCAKSKLVHLSTIPRGELRAAVMGATLTHILRRRLGSRCTKVTFFTDSTIVLFWLNMDQRPLQTLVRNSVIEVRRLSNLEDWYHVESADNIADLGTRNCEVSELGPSSPWQIGHPWMALPQRDLPIKSLQQVRLSQAEKREAALEIKA
jgi:hypothetical protein